MALQSQLVSHTFRCDTHVRAHSYSHSHAFTGRNVFERTRGSGCQAISMITTPVYCGVYAISTEVPCTVKLGKRESCCSTCACKCCHIRYSAVKRWYISVLRTNACWADPCVSHVNGKRRKVRQKFKCVATAWPNKHKCWRSSSLQWS